MILETRERPLSTELLCCLVNFLDRTLENIEARIHKVPGNDQRRRDTQRRMARGNNRQSPPERFHHDLMRVLVSILLRVRVLDDLRSAHQNLTPDIPDYRI